MPVAMPAAAVAIAGNQAGWDPRYLLDILTPDGTLYFVCDYEMQLAAALDNGNVHTYKPWLKALGQFRTARGQQTNDGDIVVQNVSGNSIVRDMQSELAKRTFEGALAVLRIVEPLTQLVLRSYHGALTAPEITDEEVTFRQVQLGDSNQVYVCDETFSEQCTLTYKLPLCGSVSGLATCDFLYASCVARGVPERFAGVLSPGSGLVYPVAVTPS